MEARSETKVEDQNQKIKSIEKNSWGELESQGGYREKREGTRESGRKCCYMLTYMRKDEEAQIHETVNKFLF